MNLIVGFQAPRLTERDTRGSGDARNPSDLQCCLLVSLSRMAIFFFFEELEGGGLLVLLCFFLIVLRNNKMKFFEFKSRYDLN